MFSSRDDSAPISADHSFQVTYGNVGGEAVIRADGSFEYTPRSNSSVSSHSPLRAQTKLLSKNDKIVLFFMSCLAHFIFPGCHISLLHAKSWQQSISGVTLFLTSCLERWYWNWEGEACKYEADLLQAWPHQTSVGFRHHNLIHFSESFFIKLPSPLQYSIPEDLPRDLQLLFGVICFTWLKG